MTQTFHLPIKTVSEANRRDHWAVRSRRTRLHRSTAKVMVRGCSLPCTVVLTRLSNRELDDDNLRGALKAVRDGIADSLGIADNDPRVRWLYAQAKGRDRVYGVRVDIAEGTWTAVPGVKA